MLAAFYILILSVGTIVSLYIPKQETAAQDTIIIPKEAIRLRILANSDLEADQNLKRKVRDEVNAHITEWVGELTSLEDARDVLRKKVPEIQRIALEVVERENMNQGVKVEFGPVNFPTKLYGNYLYPAGEYEAILITLGEGEGANWWCVLYPPLCFLDFSNGVATSPGIEEKAYAAEPTQKMDKDINSKREVTQKQPEEVTEDEPNEVVEVQEEQQNAVEVPEEEQVEMAEIQKEEQLEVTEKQEEVQTETVEITEKEENEEPADLREKEQKKEQFVHIEEEQQEPEVRFAIVELFKGITNN